MGLSSILILVGVILFVLDALHVPLANVGLFSLGWAFVVAGALLFK